MIGADVSQEAMEDVDRQQKIKEDPAPRVSVSPKISKPRSGWSDLAEEFGIEVPEEFIGEESVDEEVVEADTSPGTTLESVESAGAEETATSPEVQQKPAPAIRKTDDQPPSFAAGLSGDESEDSTDTSPTSDPEVDSDDPLSRPSAFEVFDSEPSITITDQMFGARPIDDQSEELAEQAEPVSGFGRGQVEAGHREEELTEEPEKKSFWSNPFGFFSDAKKPEEKAEAEPLRTRDASDELNDDSSGWSFSDPVFDRSSSQDESDDEDAEDSNAASESSLDDDDVQNEGEGGSRRRRRRRGGRRRGRGRERAVERKKDLDDFDDSSEEEFDEEDLLLESSADLFDSRHEVEEEPQIETADEPDVPVAQDEAPVRSPRRDDVPAWQETVSVIIDGNIARRGSDNNSRRRRSRGGGGGSGGRRRRSRSDG